MRAPPTLATLVLLVLLAGAAGCAGDDGSPVSDESLTAPGELRICTDPTRPPMEYRGNDGVLRGFEVDLLAEVARELSLAPVWVDTGYSELVSSLARGECDLIASSLEIRWEDQHTIREIEYLRVPISLLVRDGAVAPLALGLCGRPVGVAAGTRPAEILTAYAAACRAGNRPPVRAVPLAGIDDGLGRLRGGGVDAVLTDLATSEWFARRQTDRFDAGGTVPNERVHYAIGYAEEDGELFFDVRSALLTLHGTGVFADLLRRWGLDRKGVEGLPLYS